MDIKELAGLLIFYGDHKDHCGISRVLYHRAITNSDRPVTYPPCDCGWNEARKNAAGIIRTSGAHGWP